MPGDPRKRGYRNIPVPKQTLTLRDYCADLADTARFGVAIGDSLPEAKAALRAVLAQDGYEGGMGQMLDRKMMFWAASDRIDHPHVRGYGAVMLLSFPHQRVTWVGIWNKC